RKECLELAVELRRERLVRRHDQHRTACPQSHVGNGERLAGTGHTQKRLMSEAILQPLHQSINGARLVARRLPVGIECEYIRFGYGHEKSPTDSAAGAIKPPFVSAAACRRHKSAGSASGASPRSGKRSLRGNETNQPKIGCSTLPVSLSYAIRNRVPR